MNSNKSSSVKIKDNRARNFACVVYPESAAENWLDIIADLKVPAFVSPLHDLDINPDGEVKKAHYHVMVMYEGKKNPDTIKDIFMSFGGVGCDIIQSVRGYARYLCHMDNPEKHQYSEEDVLSFGGADYPSTIGLPTDKYKCIREMMNYCIDNDVYSYASLLEYASEYRYDWFRILCDSGTVVIKEYLKSRFWGVSRDSMND